MLETAGREPPAPFLEMLGITKWFNGNCANDRIDLDIRQGEIHALLGENGAGKTTLMNILYGLYHPDEGSIRLQGRLVQIKSPRDAIRLRIGMIHQHFMLIPNLSVIENILMGLPSSREPLLDLKSAEAQIKELAQRFGLEVSLRALVRDLPVGVQQRVEILKVLYRGADLLILDEPTAVLSPLEVQEFFQILHGLVKHGLSVIFISHKLEEVLAISDRITVLRRGKKVGTLPRSEAGKDRLVRMMVGHEVQTVSRPEAPIGLPVLRLEGVCARDRLGHEALHDIHLEVRAGEVLGIAGVDGNGQQELAEIVTGLRPISSGSVWVGEEDLTQQTPDVFIRAGVGYIPADRQRTGLVREFSIAENLVLKRIDQKPYRRGLLLDWKQIDAHARRIVQEFDIRATGAGEVVASLSGGNQQKVILGREIEKEMRLLVAMHPTRGLDIGATEYVHTRILEQRRRGVAVLLVSADLDEILALSDRVAVMFRGEIMGVVPGEPAYLEKIGRMMLGERQNELDRTSTHET